MDANSQRFSLASTASSADPSRRPGPGAGCAAIRRSLALFCALRSVTRCIRRDTNLLEKPAPSPNAQQPETPLNDRVDSFARRHIGPNRASMPMLATIGFDNLDALIDATVPKNIRLDRPLNLPDARANATRSPNCARSRRRTRWRVRSSAPATPTHHAAGDSAEHSRESRLVHRLHAVSGRDRAGPARSAAEFPDDDHRSDGARHRERVAAR